MNTLHPYEDWHILLQADAIQNKSLYYLKRIPEAFLRHIHKQQVLPNIIAVRGWCKVDPERFADWRKAA